MKNASQGNETQGLTVDKTAQSDEENVFRWNILLRIGVAILFGIGRVAGGLRIVLTLAPLIGVWLIRNKHHKKDPLEMIKEYKKHKLRVFFSLLAGIASLYAVGFEVVKPFSPLPQIEIVGIGSGEDKKDIGTATGYVLELHFKNTETISLNGSGYELITDSLTKKYNLSFMTGATFTISATNFFNKSVERKLKVTRSLGESELAQVAEKERVVVEEKEQDAIKAKEAENKKPDTGSTDIISTIENIVSKVGTFEVSVWKGDNFAKKSDAPPYEIIVNSGPGDIASCFDAKNKLFNVMKALYTNPSLSGKISRVRFSARGKLQASLGSNDLGFSWSDSGPSNFWKVALQYKSYEDETGSLASRTWAKQIDRSCD